MDKFDAWQGLAAGSKGLSVAFDLNAHRKCDFVPPKTERTRRKNPPGICTETVQWQFAILNQEKGG